MLLEGGGVRAALAVVRGSERVAELVSPSLRLKSARPDWPAPRKRVSPGGELSAASFSLFSSACFFFSVFFFSFLKILISDVIIVGGRKRSAKGRRVSISSTPLSKSNP
jgi:hypothetical protein